MFNMFKGILSTSLSPCAFCPPHWVLVRSHPTCMLLTCASCPHCHVSSPVLGGHEDSSQMQSLNMLNSSLSLHLVHSRAWITCPPQLALIFCANRAAANSVWEGAIVLALKWCVVLLGHLLEPHNHILNILTLKSLDMTKTNPYHLAS